jgi:hypothetical protein
VDSIDRKPVPAKFKTLDNMIRKYFDTTKNIRRYPHEAIEAGTAYMWTPRLPLFQYRDKIAIVGKDTTFTELKKWAMMGPLYKEYGTYILSHYPMQYIEHFLWPNFIKYYAPPTEFLEYYNNSKDSVSIVASSWFHYKNKKVYSRIKDPKAYPLDVYPILMGTMNVVLFTSLICFLMLNGFRQQNRLPKTMILVVTIWLLNAAFTIVSSPAAIRLQAFPILLETIFALVLVNWLWRLALSTDFANNLNAGLAQPKIDTQETVIA